MGGGVGLWGRYAGKVVLVRDGCLSVYGILTCFKRKQGRKKRALDEKKKLVFGVFFIYWSGTFYNIYGRDRNEVMVKFIIQHGSKGKSFTNFLLFFW